MQTINQLLYIKSAISSNLSSIREDFISIFKNETQRNYLFEEICRKPFDRNDFILISKNDGFNPCFIPLEERKFNVNGKERSVYLSWVAIPYLRIVGEYILKENDEEVVLELMEIIDAYISFIWKERKSNAQSLDDTSIGELIFQLPLQYTFRNRHYKFVYKQCLDDQFISVANEISDRFYPRVLNGNNSSLAKQTIKLLFSYNIHENGFRSVDSKIQEYYLKNFISNYAVQSFELIGVKLYKILFDLIEEIAEEDSYSFSSIYIESLASDLHGDFFEKLSVLLIEFLKVGIENMHFFDVVPILSLLKYYEAPIFDRISLFIIGNYYQTAGVSDFFWKGENLLAHYALEKELSFVLENNKNSFSSDEQNQFFKWVHDLRIEKYGNELEEDFTARLNSIQQQWLNFWQNGMSKQYKTVDKVVFQDPDVTPEPSLRLLNLEFDDLFKILTSRESWINYNQSGIIADLQLLDPSSRDKLLLHPSAINLLPEVLWVLFYKHEILEFEDWNAIFSLVQQLIDREKFWDFEKIHFEVEDVFSSSYSNYNLTLWKTVVTLIRKAANYRDGKYFDVTCCETACRLLISIEQRNPDNIQKFNKQNEYLDIISSLRGSVYDALIEVSISLSVQKATKEFYEEVALYFGGLLSREEVPVELLWVIGANLTKIGYMDKDWIIRNKMKLFEIGEAADLKTLKSYLFITSTVYKDLYSIIYTYYEKAVTGFIESSAYTSKLIQHICIAKIAKLPYADTIMRRVLQNNNRAQLEELIKYFGQRNKSKDSIAYDSKLILELWNEILVSVDDGKLSPDLAFDIMKWVHHFPLLEENLYRIIMDTIPLVGGYPFDYTVLSYLKDQIQYKPETVGEIIDFGLSRSLGFDFMTSNILRDIVKLLYKKGAAQISDRIVNHIIDKNLFFLVDTYEQYHFGKLEA